MNNFSIFTDNAATSSSFEISDIFSLAMSILALIGLFLIFKKANIKHPWLAFIPVYSTYVLCKRLNRKDLFAMIIGSSIMAAVLTVACVLLYVFTTPSAFWIVLAILSVLACSIIAFIANVKICLELGDRLGASAGVKIGLILLPSIFYFIVGVSNKYEWIDTVPENNSYIY